LIGLPELATEDESRLISEKAACRPYHCVEYCLRPSAMVSGVSEGRVIGPDGRFFDGGAAGEELEFVVVLVSSQTTARV